MKICTKCKELLPLTEYYKHKPAKDDKASWCKVCHLAQGRLRYALDPGKKKEQDRKWAQQNPERGRNRSKAWRDANPDRAAEVTKKYESANPEKGYARCGTRRAVKRNAKPSWANQFFIQEAYRLAKLRTKMTGFVWHVDHIVPLRSPVVCGLHCETNLQVIPGYLNMVKGNRF